MLSQSFRLVSAFFAQFSQNIPTTIYIRKRHHPDHSVILSVLDLFSPTLTKLTINGDYQPTMEYLAQPRREPGFYSTPAGQPLNGDVIMAFLAGRWCRANLPPEAQDWFHPQTLEPLGLNGWPATSATVKAIDEAEGGLFNITGFRRKILGTNLL
ncbi:hypothetical protein FRB99_000850 [Tulasnella sp. 403]|nr:hypothetical protein FRB99_000850 [Tulasnella sp. 403]